MKGDCIVSPLSIGAKDGNIHGIGAKRQCEGAQVCRNTANLTNLKEAIVSKKENITNSERTGKKDNVSDAVNFAPNSRKQRNYALFSAVWGERRGVHGIGAKRQCEGAQVCAVRKPDEPNKSRCDETANIRKEYTRANRRNASDPVLPDIN